MKNQHLRIVPDRRFRIGLCAIGLVAMALPVTGRASGDFPARGTTAAALQQDTPLTHYRAYRRMHVRNERFNQESWLECWTELNERGFEYQIVSERGSESLRDKVLRTLLQREQELIANGQAGRAELSDANYEFSEEEAAPGGERQVRLTPKRKDVLLVDGRAVLNPEGSDVLRVEGRLAKNPSFWTTLVHVVRGFARVNGARVPVYTETTAKVRFAGMSHLDVRYDYVEVNGRQVSEASKQLLADAAPR
jgi:hypothetical protein